MADKIENSKLPSLEEQQAKMAEEFASLKHMKTQMSLMNEKLTNLEQLVVEIYQALAVGRALPAMPSYLLGLVSTTSSRDQNAHATTDVLEYSPGFPEYHRVTGAAKLLSQSQYVSSSSTLEAIQAGVCNVRHEIQMNDTMTLVETSCKSRNERQYNPQISQNIAQRRRNTGFTPSSYHKKARIKQRISFACTTRRIMY